MRRQGPVCANQIPGGLDNSSYPSLAIGHNAGLGPTVPAVSHQQHDHGLLDGTRPTADSIGHTPEAGMSLEPEPHLRRQLAAGELKHVVRVADAHLDSDMPSVTVLDHHHHHEHAEIDRQSPNDSTAHQDSELPMHRSPHTSTAVTSATLDFATLARQQTTPHLQHSLDGSQRADTLHSSAVPQHKGSRSLDTLPTHAQTSRQRLHHTTRPSAAVVVAGDVLDRAAYAHHDSNPSAEDGVWDACMHVVLADSSDSDMSVDGADDLGMCGVAFSLLIDLGCVLLTNILLFIDGIS